MDTPREYLRMLDKVVLITGGCGGIGSGCVDVFVSQGAKVVVLDINDEIGNKLKDEKGIREIFYIHCDMRNEEDIKEAVDKAIEKYGRLDVLLNNVGIHLGPRSMGTVKVQEFRDLLNINLVSYMATSKFCLPHLRRTKGNIINTASVVASLGLKGSALYSATKGAIVSLTKSLALDEAQYGVRVNCISPGPTNTPMLQQSTSMVDKKYLEDISALRRLSTPEEHGKTCLYLATDATFMTGAEILCCGGTAIGCGMKHIEGCPYL